MHPGQHGAGRKVSIEVFNALGQVVYKTEVTPARSKWHMDISLGDDVANGLYLMRLTSEELQIIKPFEVRR